MGLGGGGFSRLGQRAGAPVASSVEIVRRAVELGVNFIDTAESYGTEPIVGEALRSIGRENVVLSTKKSLSMSRGGPLITGSELEHGLDDSLARLGTDYIDIYHLHAVESGNYDYALSEWVPSLLKLREQGKIRFLGITEQFANDTQHKMMERAIGDEPWDVVMVGFNMINQSARERVIAEAIRRNIGVLCMFAVRNALSKPDRLREVVAELVANGQIDRATVDLADPLGFVTETDHVGSLTEAAYRFCQAEPGIHVVLSGTGNIRHLEENVASNLMPGLPPELHTRLLDLFGRVDLASGQ
jgi:aryl-alcohol dehydrogenase-like predicted oxidoreductase